LRLYWLVVWHLCAQLMLRGRWRQRSGYAQAAQLGVSRRRRQIVIGQIGQLVADWWWWRREHVQ